jgi:hypothetical protein
VSQALSLDESYEARSGGTLTRVVTITAYSVLGVILCATRLVGLDRGFWHDEIVAVESFIRAGPRQILAGPDLSHELFSLLAWSTGSIVGESEIAYRLWSVVPFILGVVLVTAWLHVRVNQMSGVLFLFFATVSPLLLDITRQARGYGLAFLAMSVLVVAALEAERSVRTWTIVAFCAAGLVGTWTLPQFGIAFLATGAVLLTNRNLRHRAALGLGVSILSLAAWYAPHIGEVRTAAQIEDGVQIDTLWLLTAPIDQVLIPALLWIDGTVLVASLVWLPLTLVAALIIGSSTLIRERRTALVLISGVVATVVALWLGRAYVIPRYLSFLLVPLFVLLATGMAAIFARIPDRPAIVRTVASLVVVGLLAVRFAAIAPDVVRLPREAYKDAAAIIVKRGSPSAPVLAYLRNPEGLEYYLGKPVRALESSEVVARVCGSREAVIYVIQPFGVKSVDVPCLARPGVEHYRVRQYTRGDEMNVWFVPPPA